VEAQEPEILRCLQRGGGERVTHLYRRDDPPEADSWLRAPGWCLAYR
jgi:hypothetical protein